jgi:hypothetical protein
MKRESDAKSHASTPTAPGAYRYTPDMPGATPARIDIVRYKGVLCARLPDDDEIELHPVDDMTGTWSPA